MKNIIVYCLWGSDDKYWKGAVENIKLAKIYYPDFICRFYVDRECSLELINTLESDNSEVIILEGKRDINSQDARFTHNGIFSNLFIIKSSSVASQECEKTRYCSTREVFQKCLEC